MNNEHRPVIVWHEPQVYTMWGWAPWPVMALPPNRWRMKQLRVRERRALGSAAGRSDK